MLELYKILAILANFCDYWTTIIGIRKYGLKEANPLMRPLLKYPIAMAFVKLVLVTYILTNVTKNSAIFASILFGFCASNNLINILRIKYRKKNIKGV